jgi:hypothetical protein
MPRPVGGDECSDFKNPIGRTFLSGNPHFRRDWKVSAIREAPPCGRGASLQLSLFLGPVFNVILDPLRDLINLFLTAGHGPEEGFNISGRYKTIAI